MSDKERLVAEVDAGLKSRAKADPRSIREIIEQSLEREFSTTETAAIERRIDEKQQRIQTLRREINDRERELAAEEDDLERLQRQLDEYDGREQRRLEEARDALDGVAHDPSNPAVENWAEKLGLTPTELVEELRT